MSDVPIVVSNKIANMAFVCACMVVAIHLRFDRSLCNGVLHECLFNGFTRAAVPFFFVVSGWLLYGKLNSYNGNMQGGGVLY